MECTVGQRDIGQRPISIRPENDVPLSVLLCVASTEHPATLRVDRVRSVLTRLSPALQRFWRSFPWSRVNEEFAHTDSESFGEAIEKVDRGVFGLPLQAAEICTIHSGIDGQLLLRNALIDAKPAQIPRD